MAGRVSRPRRFWRTTSTANRPAANWPQSTIAAAAPSDVASPVCLPPQAGQRRCQAAPLPCLTPPISDASSACLSSRTPQRTQTCSRALLIAKKTPSTKRLSMSWRSTAAGFWPLFATDAKACPRLSAHVRSNSASSTRSPPCAACSPANQNCPPHANFGV